MDEYCCITRHKLLFNLVPVMPLAGQAVYNDNYIRFCEEILKSKLFYLWDAHCFDSED